MFGRTSSVPGGDSRCGEPQGALLPPEQHAHGGFLRGPEFNTDQGAQFTSAQWIDVLKAAGVKISMDGKGQSNGIVDRFNGTVRDESDNDYGSNYLQAEAIIAKLMHHYNEERLHAALGYMAPAIRHLGSRMKFETSVRGESLRPARIVE